MKPVATPSAQLAGFLKKFTPQVAREARAALAKLRQRVPGALELVYDNYNALAIAFAATEKLSTVVFSIAVFPRWVSLFFYRGASLPDPHQVLRGSGHLVRHIVLRDLKILDQPAVKALLAEAMKRANPKIDLRQRRRLIIKSISPRQRPRRPS